MKYLYTVKERSSPNNNFTRWKINLYRWFPNEPTFLETLKTDYSSHVQNICEHLSKDQGKDWETIRKENEFYEIA